MRRVTETEVDSEVEFFRKNFGVELDRLQARRRIESRHALMETMVARHGPRITFQIDHEGQPYRAEVPASVAAKPREGTFRRMLRAMREAF